VDQGWVAILGSPKVSVHSIETSIFTAFQRFVFRDGNLGQLLSKRGGRQQIGGRASEEEGLPKMPP
jgi:hypothetical protein